MDHQLTSMTGFGRARALCGQRTIAVEMRSLNHRGLDFKLRTIDLQVAPEIDHEILSRLRRSLVRGSITVLLRDEPPDNRLRSLDTAQLRQIHGALEDLRRELGLPGAVDLATLATFLCATKTAPVGELKPDDWPLLAPAVEAALAGLQGMRLAEGAAIASDIGLRLGHLRAIVGRIAEQAEGWPTRAARRLGDRLAALLPAGAVEPGRLAQEVAILADRTDVSEELARLRAHLEHLGGLLQGRAGESPGRRIDFLAQEIGRELNTLGSKMQDSGISPWVIDGKAELEKLREQAQNVE